ncbi:TetR/AcrR family transcriptional regulator [Klenkia terrae]|uniref:TetR/AcrR family transcriptional regulator n=1 Tax=Klenkia terrae TaxID=1052259 RepID=A0ABU8EEY5_9ACTN|nr:TetR/AcrR family transcriptional regulator [Klenkia terrae]SSC23239.1 TetR family transcriptional regulator [Klenkia terrae]
MTERVDKFAARRAELAAATLRTLAELGYARTSLREIAQNSEFSHGVLHYYFRDKVDLITHCVREYKAICVTRYDQVVATATTPAQLQEGFLDKLAQTLVEEPQMHRLWYDLRNQSMFEETFRADVAAIDASLERMVWRVVTRFAELVGTTPLVTPSVMYALFDGLFQQALVRQLAGEAGAAADLRAAVTAVVAQVVPLDREPALR